MSSKNLISICLKNQECTQKELAKKMGVSQAQVSKWKAGEHISLDMEAKLKSLAGIGNRDPDVVFWTGGTAEADKWQCLIEHLAEIAHENQETGYITFPLTMEEGPEFLTWHTLFVLQKCGVKIPRQFPEELDFNYEKALMSDTGEREVLFENQYSSQIYECFEALNDLYGFYAAFMYDDIWELIDASVNSNIENIESELLSLALAKSGEESDFMPEFNAFKYKTIRDYKCWINLFKREAVKRGIPLKAEIMNLAMQTHGEVGAEAGSESLGLNDRRLHPDIYINELLIGMRTIHQVLPAICKKLGITEEELNIDRSEYYAGN